MVQLRDLGSHRELGLLLDARRELLGQKLGELRLGRLLLHADRLDGARISERLGDELRELRKMPPVPLADAHAEQVDVLFELIEQRDRLDDHVVVAVHVVLDLGARIAVAQRELSFAQRMVRQILGEHREVHADAAQHLRHDAREHDRAADRLGHRRRESRVADAETHFLLLFRQIGFQKLDKIRVQLACKRSSIVVFFLRSKTHLPKQNCSFRALPRCF